MYKINKLKYIYNAQREYNQYFIITIYGIEKKRLTIILGFSRETEQLIYIYIHIKFIIPTF